MDTSHTRTDISKEPDDQGVCFAELLTEEDEDDNDDDDVPDGKKF